MIRDLLKKRFVQFFGISVTGTMVVVIFALINSVLTARLLGPEGKGVYTLLYSTIVLSIAVVSLKLGLSQVYFRKQYTLNELASNSIFLCCLSGSLTVGVAYAAMFFVQEDLFSGVDPHLLTITLCTIPVMLMAQTMKSMLNADYDIPRSTMAQSSRPVFFFLLFGSLALLNLADLQTAVYCIAGSITGMAVFGFVMLIRRGYSKFTLNPALLWPMVSFSLKTHVGQMFRFLQYRFDIFLVAYFMGAADAGIYSIAMALSEILWRIPRAANNVLLPRISGEKKKRSAELTARMNRIMFAFTIVCLVPFAALADWIIILLYGEEFAAAGPAVIALLPGVVALSVFKMVAPNLIMHGRAWTFSFSVVCSVIVMVASDMYLIPAYGIVGAGIGASLGYIVASLIVFVTVLRINDLPLREYFDIFSELNLLLNSRR